MENKSCCFIGHRKVDNQETLRQKLTETIQELIQQNVTTFYFGSQSDFNDLALETALKLKVFYPRIELVYVRSHYPYISKQYMDYLLTTYDSTLMPKRIENAGKGSYLERNQEMINLSDLCVFYYNKDYKPPLRKASKRAVFYYQPKSGTMLAYEYAIKKGKQIINLFNQ